MLGTKEDAIVRGENFSGSLKYYNSNISLRVFSFDNNNIYEAEIRGNDIAK
jgi:hypothetical protein